MVTCKVRDAPGYSGHSWRTTEPRPAICIWLAAGDCCFNIHKVFLSLIHGESLYYHQLSVSP